MIIVEAGELVVELEELLLLLLLLLALLLLLEIVVPPAELGRDEALADEGLCLSAGPGVRL